MQTMLDERSKPDDATKPMLSPLPEVTVVLNENAREQEIQYTIYDDISDLRAHKQQTVSNGKLLAVGASYDCINSTEAILGPTRDSNVVKGSVDPEDPQRVTWGGKAEFLLTLIGYAVGLGNVWRFPYLCYKSGGGAFLIPYILMLAVVGLPLFYMEIAFGQFASLGPITIWRLNPLFKGLGYMMVISCWMVTLYYAVVIAHSLHYVVSSMSAVLPWTKCGEWWNTPNCLTPKSSEGGHTTVSPTIATTTALSQHSTTINATAMTSAAEEFYERFILRQSNGMDDLGSPQWPLVLCLLFTWIVVSACLARGIKSLGKVVYFTAIFPYIMLTILLIRGATLEGSLNGIIYYLKPDFHRLSDSRVWTDAATQIFFSLSACTGGMIAMSSFSKFKNNCYRDAIVVAVINCGTSVYAGFVIFSVLGFMAHEKGVEVKDVAKDGPGLAFVVYPEALARMPVPQLWSIFFFLMMATLGFGSLFSMVESVMSALIDEFPHLLGRSRNQYIFRVCLIAISFLLGLPMVCKGGIYLLTLVDFSLSGFPLLIVGLLEVVAINWIYGYNQFARDIEMMLSRKPNIYWRITWQFLSPLILLALIIFSAIQYQQPRLDDYYYTSGAKALGWMVTISTILPVPVYFLYVYCRNGGLALFWRLSQPRPDWGPARNENKAEDGRYSVKLSSYTSISHNPSYSTLPRPRSLNGSSSVLSASNSLSTFTVATQPDGLVSIVPIYSSAESMFASTESAV